MKRKVAMLAIVIAAALPAGRMVLAAGSALPDEYAPYAVGTNGGEPSIGFDPIRNAAIYGAGTTVNRLTWDESKGPANMKVTSVPPTTAATTLDAITIVEQTTGRTFNSQLLGACSATSFSDDAGATWTPSQGCGVNTLLDHQSLGAGPFHAPLSPTPAASIAVYYCAQNGFNATCAVSLDGGLNFGPGTYTANTPANDPTDPNPVFAGEGGACSALHGHLKVGPDGTAYLPYKGCGGTVSAENATNTEYVGGHPSLSVSEDNGTTWTIRMVNDPGAQNPDESDPSLGIASDGTLYYGWENGVNPSDFKNGDVTQAKIAVSHDHGVTWSKPVDVSTPMGLNNVQFAEVVAGDPKRAAFAFLGTAGIGDDQANAFPNAGTSRDWHLYISTTYDGGKTWNTVDTTPVKPVQRGCIDNQGTTVSQRTDVCSQRNLLDFNDMTVDREGRVLVAYGDGCTGDCAKNPKSASAGAKDMVMRQVCGVGLYAKYDPGFTSGCTAGIQAVASPSAAPTAAPSPSPVSGGRPPLPNTSPAYVALTALLFPALAAAAVAALLRRSRHV